MPARPRPARSLPAPPPPAAGSPVSTSDVPATAEAAAVLEGPAPDPAPETAPGTEPAADLGRATARGAGVTLAGQVLRILLQLASTTVLARLLSPRDYGLLAVGLVVVGVGEVFRDMGLSTSAVRTPHLTRGQRDGLFWLNAAAGVLLGLVAFCAAPWWPRRSTRPSSPTSRGPWPSPSCSTAW